jgi:hypothetical protein
MKLTILGSALAGLSCIFYLVHENLVILNEINTRGHIAAYYRDGCYWDEGPHIFHLTLGDLRTAEMECRRIFFGISNNSWKFI